MKNRLYLAATLAVAALAGCDDRDACPVREGSDDEMTLTFTGTTTGTRTAYDPSLGAAVWQNGDRLWVGAFSSGKLQYSWYPFEMTGLADNVATFQGNIQKDPSASSHVLWAVYPGNGYAIGVPTVSTRVQKPTAESFDGACAVMCSEPLAVELDEVGSGTDRTLPLMRFAHVMGFLRLSLDGIPQEYASQKVIKVEMNGSESDALSGDFTFDVSAGAFVRGGETFPSVVLDYSDRNYTLGELTAWFAVNPGTYAGVGFRIVTEGYVFEFAPRPALEIRPGTICSRTLNFKEGDKILRLETGTLSFTCSGLGITSLSTAGVSGTTQVYDAGGTESFTIGYQKAYKKSRADDFLMLVRSNGAVWNSDPLGTGITQVRVVSYNSTIAKNVWVYFGSSPTGYLSRQTTSDKDAVFVPSAAGGYEDGADYPYFKISASSTGIPQLKSVEVTYRRIVEI